MDRMFSTRAEAPGAEEVALRRILAELRNLSPDGLGDLRRRLAHRHDPERLALRRQLVAIASDLMSVTADLADTRDALRAQCVSTRRHTSAASAYADARTLGKKGKPR